MEMKPTAVGIYRSNIFPQLKGQRADLMMMEEPWVAAKFHKAFFQVMITPTREELGYDATANWILYHRDDFDLEVGTLRYNSGQKLEGTDMRDGALVKPAEDPLIALATLTGEDPFARPPEFNMPLHDVARELQDVDASKPMTFEDRMFVRLGELNAQQRAVLKTYYDHVSKATGTVNVEYTDDPTHNPPFIHLEPTPSLNDELQALAKRQSDVHRRGTLRLLQVSLLLNAVAMAWLGVWAWYRF